MVIGTTITNTGVPTTNANATATNATTATTGWCLVASITETDIKAFIERINHTAITIHLIIEQYMVPTLTTFLVGSIGRTHT